MEDQNNAEEVKTTDNDQNDDDGYEQKSGPETKSDKEHSDKEQDVPDDFIFPSFFAFLLWGPFADPSNRLTIMETKDPSKSVQHKKGKRW